MTLWLVRAGRHGEREDFALENNVATVGWEELGDLSAVQIREELNQLLQEAYPDEQTNTLRNWLSSLWPFIREMEKGDLIAMPLKHRSVIAIGEVTGEYRYKKENPPETKHERPVKKWTEFARNQFEPDLLYSLGALRTVCRIQRNQAEERVRAMLAGKRFVPEVVEKEISDAGEAITIDLEQTARDRISSYLIRKFKGHGLAHLVGAILEAQGYQVKISPEGPDGGVDIVAGRGSLGFESPRLVVQVKSGDAPIDVGVLRELQGVMSSFGADLGLIVAWGGYKSSVEKEASRQFFKIRLWDASDLVQMLQNYYDQLPNEIQAEIPMKRIWTLVEEEE